MSDEANHSSLRTIIAWLVAVYVGPFLIFFVDETAGTKWCRKHTPVWIAEGLWEFYFPLIWVWHYFR